MTNNKKSFLYLKSSLKDLPMWWKWYQATSDLEISWIEFLVNVKLGTDSKSIWCFFGILYQNFWAIHVIGISNHRKTLPHLIPDAEINIFYWPNSLILDYQSILLNTPLKIKLLPVFCTLFNSYSPSIHRLTTDREGYVACYPQIHSQSACSRASTQL